MRTVTTVVVTLSFICIGCNEGPTTRVALPVTPTPSTPVPLPSPEPFIRVFTDAVSGVATSDVHDAQEQVFQLDSVGRVVWKADGAVYSFAGKGIEEGLIVRFGTKNGERRAYLVYSLEWYHYGPPETIVDLEVVDGKVIVTTDRPPVSLPGSE